MRGVGSGGGYFVDRVSRGAGVDISPFEAAGEWEIRLMGVKVASTFRFLFDLW